MMRTLNDDIASVDPVTGKIIVRPLPWWIKASFLFSILVAIGACTFAVNFKVATKRPALGYLVRKAPVENSSRTLSASDFQLQMHVPNCPIAEVTVGKRVRVALTGSSLDDKLEGVISRVERTRNTREALALPACRIEVDVTRFPREVVKVNAIASTRELFEGVITLPDRYLLRLPFLQSREIQE